MTRKSQLAPVTIHCRSFDQQLEYVGVKLKDLDQLKNPLHPKHEEGMLLLNQLAVLVELSYEVMYGESG